MLGLADKLQLTFLVHDCDDERALYAVQRQTSDDRSEEDGTRRRGGQLSGQSL